NGQWHLEDIFTVKLNAETGETHWLSEIDEPTWNYIGSDYGHSIDMDPLTGDVFVGGMMLIPASSSSVGQYCMIRLGDDIVNISENPFNYSEQIHNYPNPFKDLTNITYVLETDCFVKLEIFDYNGKKISNLINERQTKGKHSVIWDGKNNSGNNVSQGVYFYQLNIDNKPVSTKKMILLK
ncbi:MAG: T9SS type A sorting domain-containing protein, partial [Bacteroidales bacterium]|nr:T9SS type A sorting domain-containing protein [Bacteroidales bacterium]